MNQHKIKIFLVDDHHATLIGLKALLNPVNKVSVVSEGSGTRTDEVELTGEFCVMGTALDAETMLQRMEQLPSVDLLIIDFGLAGMNGMDAAKIAKDRHKHLKTIMYSGYYSSGLIEYAKQMDIDGFVTKEEDLKRLVEVILQVMKGHKVFPQKARPESDQLMPFIQETQPEKSSILSRRECEILCRIAKGMKSHEISKELNIAYNTVEVHRRNITKKLDIHNIAGLTKYAIEQGIIC